jgi:hypothetical protein
MMLVFCKLKDLHGIILFRTFINNGKKTYPPFCHIVIVEQLQREKKNFEKVIPAVPIWGIFQVILPSHKDGKTKKLSAQLKSSKNDLLYEIDEL